MLIENIKILLKQYYNPLAAMSEIVDSGSFIFAAVLLLCIAFVTQFTIFNRIVDEYGMAQVNAPATGLRVFDANRNAGRTASALDDRTQMVAGPVNPEARLLPKAALVQNRLPLVGKLSRWLVLLVPRSFVGQLLGLAVFYVPGAILIMALIGHIGSFGLVLSRDYGTLLACTLMAWCAANLPLALAGPIGFGLGADPALFAGFWLASSIVFSVLMVFALRVALGADYSKAAITAVLGWLGIGLGSAVFSVVTPYLFSPFIIFYAWRYLRGEGGEISGGVRRRRNFRRFLDNATLNPLDADAHLQLGLIYLSRRQDAEALKRFQRAYEIDPDDPDTNFQLGKVARRRGELQQSIDYFGRVVVKDDRFSQNEIWREIGVTYHDAGMFTEANEALEKYIERREFDSEGLYYLARTLDQLGQHDEASSAFARCIESVDSAPYYRRRELRKWATLAKSASRVARAPNPSTA